MQANGVVFTRVTNRQIVVESSCNRWKFCLSLLLATVFVEALFILFTGLHLGRDGPRGYYAVNHTAATEKVNSLVEGRLRESEIATPAPTDTPPSEFLEAYDEFCNRTLVPEIPKDHWRQACPCVPPTLRKSQPSIPVFMCTIFTI